MSKTIQYGSVQLVVIQATSFCNLDCDYCYLPDREVKNKFSLDLIEPLFTKLFASPYLDTGFSVVWHAGEPLAMPIHFYEQAIQQISDLNHKCNESPLKINHSIQSNGTLLNQAWCDFIKKYNINIGISLDGPAFLHDAHRKTRTGLGTHKGTMHGISLLRRNNIDFHVIAVLTADSLKYPEAMFTFFIDENIRRIGFNIDELEGVNQSSSLDFEKAESLFREFIQIFFELTKRSNGKLLVREFEQARGLILGKVNSDLGQFTPYTIINVAYNGDFSTFSPELVTMESAVYGNFIIGNVKECTFEEATETDKFKLMSRDVQAGVEQCRKTCQYFSVCGGGAPANKYYENGSFNSTETIYCKFTKQAMIDIVLASLEESLNLK